MADQQLSLLSGEEVASLSLVQDSDEKQFRASTYDLSVGEIIPAEGEEFEGAKFSLQPGGMVRVISRESLKLPDTITGHVLLKNELCTRGVLAVSIGVVDPGFEGPISSTLINFGKGSCTIEKGTSFLRVSFHRCPVSSKATNSYKYTREEYLKRVKQEVRAYSGPTFLNMDKMAKDAAKRAFGSFKKGIFLWATIAGIIIALLAIFAPLGASFVEQHLDAEHNAQVEQAIEQRVESRYDARFKELTDKINQLNQELITAGRKNARSNKK